MSEDSIGADNAHALRPCRYLRNAGVCAQEKNVGVQARAASLIPFVPDKISSLYLSSATIN